MIKSIMQLIHPEAKIGNRNTFGYGVRIGRNVQIGDDNYISDYVSLSGNMLIGNGNVIGTGSIFGGISNHVKRNKAKEESTTAEQQAILIGDGILCGELVTVHAPAVLITAIGSNVSIGPRTHIAHDAVIEDFAIISPHCCLGGYVRILRGANIGIGVNIHPRIVVGQYTMVGVGTVVIRHILPGATVAGSPQRYIGPNLKGMKRNDLSFTCIEELSKYLNQEQVESEALSVETQQILLHFFDIIKNSKYVRDVTSVPSRASLL